MSWFGPILRMFTVVTLFAVSLPVFGQTQSNALAEDLAGEDDRGFLTRLLEDSLGGEGRVVRIEGFQGALSRRATITRATVADEQGVWLTMRDIAMEWNRAALLRGRVEITSLRAAEILLERAPMAEDDGLPAPEAPGFSLPDLPVAVLIDNVVAERIAIGAPILGEAAEMSLTASARLESGEADLKLDAKRTDGATGRFVIDASYDGSAETVSLALDLSEAENGIVARLLDIRDRPALRLVVDGNGPLNNLVTDIQLQTDGQDRLSGRITLLDQTAGPDERPVRNFDLDFSGDLAPLFPERYTEFFGNRVELKASGSRAADGALDVSDLAIASGASELRGAVALSSDRLLERVALEGEIASEDGEPLLLPISGGSTRLTSATIEFGYDVAISEDWTASMLLSGLSSAEFGSDTIRLLGTGVFRNQTDLAGEVEFEANGLRFASEAIGAAVGNAVSGRFDISRQTREDLHIRNIEIDGEDYSLSGDVSVEGVEQEFSSDIDVQLEAQDLQRLAALTGVDLAGRADLGIRGTADLGGRFDLGLQGTATDLTFGVDRADPYFDGRTVLRLSAVRDGTGTRLTDVVLINDQIEFSGDVDLVTEASEAAFDLRLNDGTSIDPALKGPLSLVGTANQTADGWSIAARAGGPYDATAMLAGMVTGTSPSLTFAASIPDIQKVTPGLSGAAQAKGTLELRDGAWHVATDFEGPYGATSAVNGRVTGEAAPDIRFEFNVPDVSLVAPGVRGALRIDGTARQSDEGIRVATDLQGPYGVNGTVSGTVTGQAPQLTYSLRLPNVASVGAPFSGPLALDGTARGQGGEWLVDTEVAGPGGMTMRLNGTVNSRSSVNLVSSGSFPLGLANPFLQPRNLQGNAEFSLALQGPPALSALSGSITTSGASLSAPTLQNRLSGIAARVVLANGRADVEATGGLSSGGRVSVHGFVNLNGAMDSDIALQLQAVRLIDPNLYTTSLNGNLRLQGPVRGGAAITGRIDIGETEIQIPSSQAPGFTIIPEIAHVGASPAVRQTLRRAGLDAASRTSRTSSNGGFGLDILVSAPARVFVRGRGLDAEVGGSLRLQGDTGRIISTGGFELIRGRLDILGKRFVLDQGRVDFQGQVEPFIRFVATTSIPSGSASIEIQGPATQPSVSFSSSPAAPEDEILAQIFFGRGISQLSAFQALQLASAVATLAGGSGDTILSRLRKSFGVDDLDVTTDEGGSTALRVGKYLSDNVYTDVTVGDQNSSGVSLNVDLTPNLKARGTLNSDGNSSVGIFFERDY